MTVLILSTAFQLIAVIACAVAVGMCTRQAERSFEHALKLRNERDRVSVSERDIEALRRELRKLSGKFYAERRKPDDDDLPDYTTPKTPIGTCDNWNRAIIEGPRSPAAACECDFCVGMRTARRAEKAAILASRPLLSTVKRGE